MTGPITRHRDIESLKIAARWPGADRATTVTLATRLAAVRADAEGYRYFCELADAQPGEPLPLALAGFFQARLGRDVDAALAKLDQAAAADLGLPQYLRGLALAGLPPDRERAGQAVADLEFVLAVRDQFPPLLLRSVHHGLAAAYAVLGQDEQAAEAERRSGLGAVPAGTQLMFGGFWATAADGFRFTSPRIFREALWLGNRLARPAARALHWTPLLAKNPDLPGLLYAITTRSIEDRPICGPGCRGLESHRSPHRMRARAAGQPGPHPASSLGTVD